MSAKADAIAALSAARGLLDDVGLGELRYALVRTALEHACEKVEAIQELKQPRRARKAA